MSACGCGGKPDSGAITSSFQMRKLPQPAVGSVKAKWCLALSQPRSLDSKVGKGRRSIMTQLQGG